MTSWFNYPTLAEQSKGARVAFNAARQARNSVLEYNHHYHTHENEHHASKI
jgi:hypothetical protein